MPAHISGSVCHCSWPLSESCCFGHSGRRTSQSSLGPTPPPVLDQLPMLSTMQDRPLTIAALLHHGRTVYAGSQVATFEGERTRHATFADVADRAQRLAAALRRLGIRAGDRVGTFEWNTQ